VTKVDAGAIVFCLLTAFIGWRKGLVASAFSLAGIVVGAWLGSRLAPELLDGGAGSPYTPLAALAGAAVGAIVLETLGTFAGTAVRTRLRTPRLRSFDAAAGTVLGGVAGLTVVWVIGAVALLWPGQSGFREGAQQSFVLRRLNEVVPPRELLNALARIDPFPAITGPAAPAQAPDPRVGSEPAIERAAASVVRVLGTACGIGVEGTGWVAKPGLVVTAAHVVAGERDTLVALDTGGRFTAQAVAFDPRNDIAVLRVEGLDAQPLRLVDPKPGTAVAVIGYPENGPLTSTPGRIGRTAVFPSEDAYGRGPVLRGITALRGFVRHGDSGAPAVDVDGAVQTTVFAARRGSRAGYGVPTSAVRNVLGDADAPVSTGGCAP
jgi:S1-C subfamily serine protease